MRGGSDPSWTIQIESPALMRPGLEMLFLLAGETALMIAIHRPSGNAQLLTSRSERDLHLPISTLMTTTCG